MQSFPDDFIFLGNKTQQFTVLGELLNSFKEIIKDGLCWFPRLMRWQTSKGEVSPVFEDNRNEGCGYRLKSYMDIHTRQE